MDSRKNAALTDLIHLYCMFFVFIFMYSPDCIFHASIKTGIVWSTNFAVLKDIFAEVPDMDPSLYCAIRFSIAGLVMLPSAFGHFGNFDLVLRSSYIGVAVMFGYVGQTMGMQSGSTASMSAFMCTLNVVWVAFLVGMYTRKWRVETWVAILFAIAGVGFLELAGTEPAKYSDLWLICQPIGFGSGYLLLEDVLKDYPDDANAITSFKVLAITVLSTLWTIIFDGNGFAEAAVVMQSPVAFNGILYTGLITTAAAIWVQSIAFKKVSAKDVSMILTTEPIWAALFSMWLVGEKVSFADCFGMFLIIVGNGINEMDFEEMGLIRKKEKIDTVEMTEA